MATLYSDWSVQELKAIKRKLEEMVLSGVRQSTFKDQTLIFSSRAELRQALNDATAALTAKEGTCGDSGAPVAKKKKQIRVTTRSKGFR